MKSAPPKFIAPATHPIHGEIEVPGDKSITHRAIILGSIAKGDLTIFNPSFGKDCLSTLTAMKSLGVPIERIENILRIHSSGLNQLSQPKSILDAGNSGTTIRLLAGLLAGTTFKSEITGDASLKKRPMDRVITPLRLMGAHIDAKPGGGLSIEGRSLKGIRYALPIASAQVKSCLLLASLNAIGPMEIVEPIPTRDHTERMLEHLGFTCGEILKSNQRHPLNAKDIYVPGDISSAAFFIVAALLAPNSDLLIKNVGINPTRIGLMETLQRMGAKITFENSRFFGREPVADIRVKSSRLAGTTVEANAIPRMIDEIPILAVAAANAISPTMVHGIGELRFKESDRIATLVEGFRSIGVEVRSKDDDLWMEGLKRESASPQGGIVDSFNDHRIAMAFAIAGLISKNGVTIENSDCVDISFPGFFELLTRLTHK